MDIQYTPLFTVDIKSNLKNQRVCNNIFKGVFAADTLPNK